VGKCVDLGCYSTVKDYKTIENIYKYNNMITINNQIDNILRAYPETYLNKLNISGKKGL
jgi:spore coat polysaccharide biosynthesis protein SpsF (cytidylyltransferase family)